MKPIQFKEANIILTAHPGDEQKVQNMPAYSNTKLGLTISCWELDGEELLKICETKKVYLHVMGDTQPPVMLSIKSPFKEDKKE